VKPGALAPRAAAVLVDGVIVFAGFGALIALATGQAHHSSGSYFFRLHGGPAWIWIAASWGYWVVLERMWGTTVGKRLFGLRVTSADGTALTWGQSIQRNLMRLIDSIPFVIPYLLGFVVAVTDDEKRRLGDRVADTRVVTSSSS
jgi:uncharacterized RDD family membrane protein YckC